MIAYKGFNSDLTCRGYKFSRGLNVTEKANCAANGFHCAENPLDCLYYYSNIQDSVYYIVNAGGDIDEDGNDSKISCTELTLIKQISVEQLILFGLAFMVDHPKLPLSSEVSNDKAEASGGFAVVRGLDPIAKGRKKGDILAFAKNSPDGSIIEKIALTRIDGITVLPNVWYGIDLNERGDKHD